MKIRLSDLKARANSRPEGYYDDILSHGVVENGFLKIKTDEYLELVKKYNPQALEKPQEQSAGCCGHRNQLPSIATQARNALGAAGRIISASVTGNRVKAADEVVLKRKDICNACEFLLNQSRCTKCGCFYKAKVTFETEKCPIGKW